MTQEYELIGTRDFIHNDKTYRYDPDLITIEQAEQAAEILDFKSNQRSKDPEKFDDVVFSGGSSWRRLVLTYLLTEVKDGQPVPYSSNNYRETKIFVESLPAVKYFKSMEECMTDFFSCIGLRKKILDTISGSRKLSATDLISSVMQMNLGKQNAPETS